MQINSLTKCCKPRQFGSSATESSPKGKRVRYKHYEEMNNEVLGTYCLAKAYNTVQSSRKMKLRNSIPEITALAIGTSLALTQPGKLASKAAKGLGFLAMLAGFNALIDKTGTLISNFVEKKSSKSEADDKKAALLGIGAGAAIFGVAVTSLLVAPRLASKFLSKSGNVSKFLLSEKDKLANELNNSKVGKFVENSVNPFMQKHNKLSGALAGLFPFGAIIGGAFANNALDNSLSSDVRKNATNNFIKAKLIQREARRHFDQIDAKEI